MASDVDICNMGLRHLGLAPISALDPPVNQTVRDCALFYPQVRDLTLRDHPWNFAAKRRSLTSFTLSDDYAGEYLYAYVFPADCLMPRGVYLDGGTKPQDYKVMRAATNEKIILTDVENAILEYTMIVTNTTWFSVEFVEAAALLMAGKLAVPLRQDKHLAEAFETKYRGALAAAVANDAQEDQDPEEDDVPWIDARGSTWG